MTDLLTDIKAFCVAKGLSHTRFGELALNDRPFVMNVENGRRLWPETEAKVRKFMAEYVESQAA